MPTYRAPIKDMNFILHDVLNIQQYNTLPGYNEASPDIVAAILEEAGKFVENELQPLNHSGDQEGCTRHEDGSVTTPKGFKEAYAKFIEGGWTGLSSPVEYGGQGMPHVLGMCLEELLLGANHAFAMYPGLSMGAMSAIRLEGTDTQKDKYLPPMIEGRWTGTMNLTEAHCGTDLGLMKTKATPQADGSYSVKGQKIFISAGEHDLTENIVHLVLAKTPDGPDNIKGVSLFIVPKFNVNEDGSLGKRNGVTCGSIEEKMGIHGNSTCVLNYDGAQGYLLGEINKGMRAMFIMMNAARIGVGIQGLAHSEVSYQNAVDYAKDRLQMRSLTGPKNPDGPADPIIVHPDVRRMLLNSRSFNEAARTLMLECALDVDMLHIAETLEERQAADDRVSLLTPVLKGVFTDRGYENATNAQQVYGGHGYIQEWGMDQFVRDVRIAQIYEGTNGVQALDLVGRKLGANGGRAMQAYMTEIATYLKANADNDVLADYLPALNTGFKDLQAATMWLMQNGLNNPDNAGAGSVAYMHLLGHVALGYTWCKIALAAQEKLDAGDSDIDYLQNKITIGRYYMRRRMIETAALRAEVEAGAEDVMALDAAGF